jgi:hypothetical protein
LAGGPQDEEELAERLPESPQDFSFGRAFFLAGMVVSEQQKKMRVTPTHSNTCCCVFFCYNYRRVNGPFERLLGDSIMQYKLAHGAIT